MTQITGIQNSLAVTTSEHEGTASSTRTQVAVHIYYWQITEAALTYQSGLPHSYRGTQLETLSTVSCPVFSVKPEFMGEGLLQLKNTYLGIFRYKGRHISVIGYTFYVLANLCVSMFLLVCGCCFFSYACFSVSVGMYPNHQLLYAFYKQGIIFSCRARSINGCQHHPITTGSLRKYYYTYLWTKMNWGLEYAPMACQTNMVFCYSGACKIGLKGYLDPKVELSY